MKMTEKPQMRRKKIRYGIPQTTDGRVIRWFVDTFEEMKEDESK